MLMSVNIPRKLWDGKIPACFELATHELCSSLKPGSYYIMLPRSSYLTLFTDQIKSYFDEFIDKNKIDEIWFEVKGKTVKWHYPCGLLFDLLCDHTVDLPWHITVHLQSFPEEDIMRCPNMDAIEAHYISVLKEADQLKHRMHVYSAMNQSQHRQLWHGLKTDNFDEFWDINGKFMEGFEGTHRFKNIPLRIYYGKRIIQKLFSSVKGDDSDKNVTLFDALNTSLPDLFQNDTACGKFSVLIQGIEPPLHTPLQWLSENVAYADNFLHICISA